jgi:tellurite resistance protein TehA-like permease
VFSWSVGVFLYAAVGILVVARMLFYPLRPEDLTPPYWVAMGATAITVLAGARIVEMADAPMVTATRGLIAGASVMFWAFGSWLVPPLIAGSYWRASEGFRSCTGGSAVVVASTNRATPRSMPRASSSTSGAAS